VGRLATDVFMLGPQLGYSAFIFDAVVKQLEKVYQQTFKEELAARINASIAMEQYVKTIIREAQPAPQEVLPSEAAPQDSSSEAK
jgi:hypothetical protein